MNQENPLLQGDLLSALLDYSDLRNDNADSEMQQMRMIIMRYLESGLGDENLQFEEMFEDMTRHYPFIGDRRKDFREALESLEQDGLVQSMSGNLSINKVASSVAHKYWKKVQGK